jgi:hypothetical protein
MFDTFPSIHMCTYAHVLYCSSVRLHTHERQLRMGELGTLAYVNIRISSQPQGRVAGVREPGVM